MVYTVSALDLSKITLNETDPIKSVLQSIAIILRTRQMSVPLYRDFGLPMQFLDKPMPAARPLMIAEIRDAILAYEPRANVLGIDFAPDPNIPGKLIPTVEVEIINE